MLGKPCSSPSSLVYFPLWVCGLDLLMEFGTWFMCFREKEEQRRKHNAHIMKMTKCLLLYGLNYNILNINRTQQYNKRRKDKNGYNSPGEEFPCILALSLWTRGIAIFSDASFHSPLDSSPLYTNFCTLLRAVLSPPYNYLQQTSSFSVIIPLHFYYHTKVISKLNQTKLKKSLVCCILTQ